MRNGKVKMGSLTTGNPFYPGLDDAFGFLGFKTSPRAKLKWIDKLTGLKSTELISDRSLDNLAKGGVTPKTLTPIAWKLYRFVTEKEIPIQRARELEPIHKADTHMFWMQFVEGLEWGQKDIDPLYHLDFTAIKTFLEQRNEHFQPQLEWVKNFNKEEDKRDGNMMVSLYAPVIPHTCLSEQEKQILLEALQCYPNMDNLAPSVSQIVFLFLNDFYLSIFAIVDFTHVEYFKKHTESIGFQHRPDFSWPENGYITEIIQQEGKCYFGRFINFIKKRTGKSYSELATAVPVNFNDATESGRSHHDAQVETLKDWRKGKTQPTVDTLSTFFANLGSMFCGDYSLYGTLFQSIDRYIRFHAAKSDEPEKAKKLLEKVFSEQYYKRYYQKAKNLPNVARD